MRELFEDAESRRLLQLRGGRRQPGDAHEGGLRRRGAFGQFGGGAEPAAAGRDHGPRRSFAKRRTARWRAFGSRACAWRRWRFRRCWRRASFCWAEPRQIILIGTGGGDTRALLAHAALAFRAAPRSCCWWIRAESRRSGWRRDSRDRSDASAGRAGRGVSCAAITLASCRFPSRTSSPSCYNR